MNKSIVKRARAALPKLCDRLFLELGLLIRGHGLDGLAASQGCLEARLIEWAKMLRELWRSWCRREHALEARIDIVVFAHTCLSGESTVYGGDSLSVLLVHASNRTPSHPIPKDLGTGAA